MSKLDKAIECLEGSMEGGARLEDEYDTVGDIKSYRAAIRILEAAAKVEKAPAVEWLDIVATLDASWDEKMRPKIRTLLETLPDEKKP